MKRANVLLGCIDRNIIQGVGGNYSALAGAGKTWSIMSSWDTAYGQTGKGSEESNKTDERFRIIHALT